MRKLALWPDLAFLVVGGWSADFVSPGAEKTRWNLGTSRYLRAVHALPRRRGKAPVLDRGGNKKPPTKPPKFDGGTAPRNPVQNAYH